ncbi:MAG: 50S ribosomal protein L4 [Clostridia bacterium]|nr:50S ribosomal protein L4 [Clostridia bacterium]
MPKIAVLNQEGAKVKEIELNESVFASEINESAIHLVVRSQLAAKRQGTQSAKTRGEVRGGGRKIYRQKGTGNARHHGNRVPQFTHGGVVFAPKPRDYVIKVPKKVRRLALHGVLTSKVNENEMIVLDKIALTQPKTREVAKILKNIGIEKTALLVLAGPDESVTRASANIPGLKTVFVNTLNVYDILASEKFVITEEAVKLVEEVYA